jgi:hypothetical protein
VTAPKKSNIQVAFETAGEMPAPLFNEAIRLYCRWMIRLYLDRQEEQQHDHQLGVI